jgi:uncharacterized protein
MATYQTPGVYIQEVPLLPPSVAEVSTAIPVFIGYTERGFADGEPVLARINTLLEYEARFGKAQPTKFDVKIHLDADSQLKLIDSIDLATGFTATPKFSLYYALSLYFKNGGGSCYVVSLGGYSAAPKASDFSLGLERVEREDEPTLLVLTDAVSLPLADYHSLCQEALAQCRKLGDRFAIFDVRDTGVDAFRTGIGTSDLMYGAAYHPYLLTALNYRYEEDQVTIIEAGATPPAGSAVPTLASLRSTETSLYNRIKAALADQRVVLPPSGAVAGAYARVDRERGVWKAPANVSLSSVIGPTVKLTNGDQESLNIDTNAGKSINAIRAFAGKGTLIWGARTLAGNDNEWCFVSVRRLFIMVEESAMKATNFAVFEANDATTWLKVKGMLEAFLYGLWERGALAGPTPESAYFVNVGLGKTMTQQDVLKGLLIVEVGLAAVRPAEFIVLKFTHKLQEA